MKPYPPAVNYAIINTYRKTTAYFTPIGNFKDGYF